MADPFSVLAVLGLVFAGRKLSQDKQNTEKYQNQLDFTPTKPDFEAPKDVKTGNVLTSKDLAAMNAPPSFAVVAQQGRSSGAELLDMKDRFNYDMGRMNNLSPVEKSLVGPGLGVSSDVPAVGGFQQLFRAMPENVGAYRLTTLPGRSGPPTNTSGGRRTLNTEVGFNRPEKTAFLPSRLPNVEGRAQGQGGALTGVSVREEYEKTKRTTNRAETSYRGDGLSFAPGKHFVSAEQMAQDPTRNKADLTDAQYKFNNLQAPGITNFYGGYKVAAESRLLSEKGENGYTYAQLEQYGLRGDDKRGKMERQGNAGRMNVRESPLKQGGLLTAVRSDTTRMDGRVGPVDGERQQNYLKTPFHNFNAFKGIQNPLAKPPSLNIAKNQLARNPLAHSISN